MAEPVYKILSESAFAEAKAKGRFSGSPVDLRDGFIHLSSAGQVAGTLAKHFPGQAGLLLVAIDAGALGQELKWEVSRGGELFPHLYGELDLAALLWAEPLPLENGIHRLPMALSPLTVREEG